MESETSPSDIGAIYHGVGKRYADACLSKVRLPADILALVAAWMKKPTSFLLFSGNAGIGKTYLCAAIINRWHKEKKDLRYFSMQKLLTRIKSVIDAGHDSGAELQRLCEVEYFFLDDLGATLQDTEFRADKVLQFVDDRYNSTKPTIITTNLNREEIAQQYSERVASRLFSKENLVIEFVGKDMRKPEEEEKNEKPLG